MSCLDELKGHSFVSTGDLTQDQFTALIDLAYQQKTGAVAVGQPLAGKQVILLFFNPSLRTRTSMMIGVQQLGGNPVLLEVGSGMWQLEHREGVVMDGNKAEHIKEAIPVLAGYADAIAMRCFPFLNSFEEDKADPMISAFVKYSPVPILNMESAMYHPMQAGADMLTIRERFGSLKKRKVVLSWAWHPKALPMAVPNSFALAASQCGMDLTIACPPEYALDADLMTRMEAEANAAGGSVSMSHDLHAAADDADVIYAKSWGSLQYYGRPEEELKMREAYRHWMIDDSVMTRTNEGLFMHCLPVRRNVIVSDSVIDSPQSVVVQQAENRLHFQKALMSVTL
jgi:N-acetylornithine carbamoyltransferase